ncbi:hypothetical protein FRAAL6887 [Frankia alni ACN14a]|uniref:Uncharacterized protein n=1 Tax=Frankia alni (strain DSM 45986 / CECT 9034 / ACN14a) TaxID=326424 RepID=Q0RAK7_FRAAA|nr:hypothetical protein FRAAL6887 [Frankia alni ACN14a]
MTSGYGKGSAGLDRSWGMGMGMGPAEAGSIGVEWGAPTHR